MVSTGLHALQGKIGDPLTTVTAVLFSLWWLGRGARKGLAHWLWLAIGIAPLLFIPDLHLELLLGETLYAWVPAPGVCFALYAVIITYRFASSRAGRMEPQGCGNLTELVWVPGPGLPLEESEWLSKDPYPRAHP